MEIKCDATCSKTTGGSKENYALEKENEITFVLPSNVNLIDRIYNDVETCPVCELALSLEEKHRVSKSLREPVTQLVQNFKLNCCAEIFTCPYCMRNAGTYAGYGRYSPETNTNLQKIIINHVLGLSETVRGGYILRVNSDGDPILSSSSYLSGFKKESLEVRKNFKNWKSKFCGELFDEANSLRPRQKSRNFVNFILKQVFLPLVEKCEKIGAFFQLIEFLQTISSSNKITDNVSLWVRLSALYQKYKKSLHIENLIETFGKVIVGNLTIYSIIAEVEAILVQYDTKKDSNFYKVVILVCEIVKNIEVSSDFTVVIASCIEMLQEILLRDNNFEKKMDKITELTTQKFIRLWNKYKVFIH
jgi:hypothetical protein